MKYLVQSPVSWTVVEFDSLKDLVSHYWNSPVPPGKIYEVSDILDFKEVKGRYEIRPVSDSE